jgi:hypothetical protein
MIKATYNENDLLACTECELEVKECNDCGVTFESEQRIYCEWGEHLCDYCYKDREKLHR